MNETTNLKLQKPVSDEKYNIAIQNGNMDILDTEIKELKEADQMLLPKSAFSGHISDADNPHHVTKTQLGLSHVTNVRQIPAITETVTANGVPVFDGNGYQLKDSGFLIGASVPSNAKFTDTVYEHPKSEILTGTYSSVFVNEEGHVVHGENPTTLAGYGITDGEIKGSSSTALLDAKKYTDVQVAAIQGGSNLKRMIVAALPTANIDQNMIYLVPRSDAVSDNKYNEYINIDGTASGWEYIGNTAIDLADYYNKSEQNRLFLLKDRVVQENVNDESTVPSSAVLYGNCNSLLKKIDEVNGKLSNLVCGKAVLTSVNSTMLQTKITFAKPPISVVAMPSRYSDGFASAYKPSQITLKDDLNGTNNIVWLRMYSQTNSFTSDLSVPIWYIGILPE